MEDRSQLRADDDDASALLRRLETAFGARVEPERLWSSDHVPEDVSEVQSFRNLDWSTLSVDHLARNHSALYFFSPEAFRFFLPRVLASGLREGRTDILAYDSIVGSLDRSPRTDYWDDGFRERWEPLSAVECSAVQEWLLWLQREDGESYPENAFDRAFDTLTSLSDRANERDRTLVPEERSTSTRR